MVSFWTGAFPKILSNTVDALHWTVALGLSYCKSVRMLMHSMIECLFKVASDPNVDSELLESWNASVILSILWGS